MPLTPPPADDDPESPSSEEIDEIIEGRVRREVLHVFSEEFYSGPLPPPAVLERYYELYPQAPEIIFESFRKQVDHRIALETKALDTNARRSTEGLRLGFVISLVVIVFGGILVLMGHEQAGIAFVAIDIAALAAIFVYGSQQQRGERKEKAENMLNTLRGRRLSEQTAEPQNDT